MRESVQFCPGSINRKFLYERRGDWITLPVILPAMILQVSSEALIIAWDKLATCTLQSNVLPLLVVKAR